MSPLPSAGELFDEAIRESLKIEEPAEMANAHLETIRTLLSVGETDHATAMLPGTLLRIRELDDPRERAFLMRLFIELQCEMYRLDDMLGTLKLLDFDPEQRQAALRIAGETLARCGRIDEARQLLEEIEDLDDDESVRTWIGIRLAEEKRFEEAFAEAEEIEPGLDRTVLLRNIAVEQWQAGSHSDAAEAVQKSLASARQIEEEWIRDGAINAAIDGFVVLHLVSEAMDAAREIVGLPEKAEIFRRLGFFLWRDGNTAGGRSMVDDALETARKITGPFHRIESLQEIGTVLHRMGDTEAATGVFREVQTAIKSVQNSYSRAKLLAKFADRVAEAEMNAAARRIFRFAAEAVETIEDPTLRMSLLGSIVELQAETSIEDATETLEIMEEDEFDRTRLEPSTAERMIAVAMGRVGRLQDGIDLARRIADPLERTTAMQTLAVIVSTKEPGTSVPGSAPPKDVFGGSPGD